MPEAGGGFFPPIFVLRISLALFNILSTNPIIDQNQQLIVRFSIFCESLKAGLKHGLI